VMLSTVMVSRHLQTVCPGKASTRFSIGTPLGGGNRAR
jgi:hypothetical protein